MPGWQHDKRSAKERGYGPAWARLRLVVLRRDHYLCQCSECAKAGRVRVANEVDHIVPKAKGGTDALENLQAISKLCHRIKSQKDLGNEPKVAVGVDGWPISD